MWLYLAVRPAARLSFRLFFKRIEIFGLDQIPSDKPVILAANHPTGFIDPCLLAVFWPRPLHFLTRGDMFSNPLVSRILFSLNMIPIFRFRNGFSALKKNADSFKISTEKLAAKAHIVVFAEGSCIHERRLRPVQRGAARLALDTLAQYPALDLHIVPVGLHYSDATRPRTTACIHIRPPIQVRQILTGDDKNDARTLTTAIEEALRSVVPHNPHRNLDNEVDFLVLMLDNNKLYPPFPVTHTTDKHRTAAYKMCLKIADLAPIEQEALAERIAQYRQDLTTNRIPDAAIVRPFEQWRIAAVARILGWLPALTGRLAYRPVLYLSERIVKHTVPYIEFKNSVRWVSISGLTIIWLVICAGLGLYTRGIWRVFWFSLPVLSYYSLYYTEFVGQYRAARRLQQIPADALQRLTKKRQEILDIILG